jgi:predicted nucleic acid-binding protein
LTRIVLDASITLSWCFADEQTSLSLNVLEQLRAGDQALVPAFWSIEVLNSLLVGERRGRISAGETRAFLTDIVALSPVFDHATLEQVYGPIQALCRDHKLTPYDALYVELAWRNKCPLATLDQFQKRAAIALKIECL